MAGVELPETIAWTADPDEALAGVAAVVMVVPSKYVRATLETLLGAITPSGQIPANVRIDTGEPDYGGVGNICSIDSGLWLVVAVQTTVTSNGNVNRCNSAPSAGHTRSGAVGGRLYSTHKSTINV